jgi:hypothetical protein
MLQNQRTTTAGAPATSPTTSASTDSRISNVDTAEEASQITGYAIGTPGFHASGFLARQQVHDRHDRLW